MSVLDKLGVNIQRKPTDSGVIKSVGFDKGILELEFHSGGIYRYREVPERIFKNMLTAESIGSFYHNNIKGQYESMRKS